MLAISGSSDSIETVCKIKLRNMNRDHCLVLVQSHNTRGVVPNQYMNPWAVLAWEVQNRFAIVLPYLTIDTAWPASEGMPCSTRRCMFAGGQSSGMQCE